MIFMRGTVDLFFQIFNMIDEEMLDDEMTVRMCIHCGAGYYGPRKCTVCGEEAGMKIPDEEIFNFIPLVPGIN